MKKRILSFLATFTLQNILLQVHAGNTTCLSDSLDWYTDAVGETPCTTYQRLRQICNREYQVPSFRSTVPGDNCDDEVSECCCNSIAWALSMLCMNCQQLPSTGAGIDAPAGAYALYISPSPEVPTNQSLPNNIPQAVCNENIKLDDTLYNLFWGNGAWFYTYTREAAETDQTANNNDTFTHCPGPTSSGQTPTSSTTSSAPTGSPTATSQVLSTNKGSPIGAIVGGVVGGVCVLVVAVLLGLYYQRRARNRRDQVLPPQLIPFNAEEAGRRPPMRAVSQVVYHGVVGDDHGSHPAEKRASGHQSDATPSATLEVPDSVSPPSSEVSSTTALIRSPPSRELDAGPAVEFVRSASGRLPPSYSDLSQALQQPDTRPGYV